MQATARLREPLKVIPSRLESIPPEQASHKPAPHKWSPKEELGHLIDSASNNHQRIVRAQFEQHPSMPGYDGDACRRPGLPSGFDGNFLIDFISGAEIHIIDLPRGGSIMELQGVKEHVAKVVDRERKAGRKAYVAPIGASLVEGSMGRPLGALSYVNAFLELLDQFQAQNLDPRSLVFATGSGSMQAGLLVGAKMFSPQLRVLGISVSDDSATMSRYVETIAQQTIREFVFGRPVTTSEIIVLDSYMGEGYGILDRSTAEAIRLMAEAEGVILDPVYSGRAWAALVDLIGQGYFHAGETIVFLHTGGTPALFPYREEFRAFLRANPQSAGL